MGGQLAASQQVVLLILASKIIKSFDQTFTKVWPPAGTFRATAYRHPTRVGPPEAHRLGALHPPPAVFSGIVINRKNLPVPAQNPEIVNSFAVLGRLFDPAFQYFFYVVFFVPVTKTQGRLVCPVSRIAGYFDLLCHEINFILPPAVGGLF